MMKLLLVTLCCATVLFNFNNGLVSAEEKIRYTATGTDPDYIDWFPAPASQQFRFKIRAKSFKVMLAPYPVRDIPNIEVNFNDMKGLDVVIMYRDSKTVKNLDIPKVNAGEQRFQGYWVSWMNNQIKIGLEGTPTEILSWTDPNPFAIYYVGIKTFASQNRGIWIIE